MHVEGSPVLVRAWHRRDGHVALRAEAIDPQRVRRPASDGLEPVPAGRPELGLAIDRMRFALGVDDDLRPFYRRFRADPLLGPVIRRKPWLRPRRRPWPWEALAWAITKQLIESSRASAIQRRMVRAWGSSINARGPRPLFDVPSAPLIAERAPAELVALDLSEGRALAMVRCAREVASGRADLTSAAGDRRLTAIRAIGPWTVQCLGLYGRGDPDSLPAGDLGLVKLVGRVAGLGRRATVDEVEEFFAPYAPHRGLAGTFALVGHAQVVAKARPHRWAA
jgi:3-methyladenine DNA glycosylase/8-oxoguanine DNA glycosylase